MSKDCLVIGISGVTCSGKTTLAKELNKLLKGSVLISQDDYFLNDDDPRHVRIASLNHVNYELLSSLDMPRMYEDIRKVIEISGNVCENGVSSNVAAVLKEKAMKLLIIEGFSFLAYKEIEMLCDIKYFLTLTQEECWDRRKVRTYEPPDCPGYFEECVWPEYLLHLKYLKSNVKDIQFYDGNVKNVETIVLNDILDYLTNKSV